MYCMIQRPGSDEKELKRKCRDWNRWRDERFKRIAMVVHEKTSVCSII